MTFSDETIEALQTLRKTLVAIKDATTSTIDKKIIEQMLDNLLILERSKTTKLFPKYPPVALARPHHWAETTLIENEIPHWDHNACKTQLAWMLEQYNKAEKK